MNFGNKLVLVTGGTRGIGQTIARAFAGRGATAAVSHKSDHEAATAALSGLAGDGHIGIDGDLADPDFAGELIDHAVEGLGGLDVVVNNAGTFDAHPIDEVDYSKWRQAWPKRCSRRQGVKHSALKVPTAESPKQTKSHTRRCSWHQKKHASEAARSST